jgi:hypothetical protein
VRTQKSDTFMPFLNRDSNCSGSMPPLLWNGELFALIIGIEGTKGDRRERIISTLRATFLPFEMDRGGLINVQLAISVATPINVSEM